MLTLPYVSIVSIRSDILELTFREGVEVTPVMVDELHEVFKSQKADRIGLLVDQIVDFEYSFDAQIRLFDLEKISAIAMLVYSQLTLNVSKSILSLPGNDQRNAEIFTTRDDAIKWIENSLEFYKEQDLK